MSNAAPPSWVRELSLPSGAWRCLVGLWGFAKYGAEAPAQVWPARETLALATGQKAATVAKQLRKLAGLRWILRAPNGVLWLAWRIPWSSGRIPWSSDTPVAEPATTVTGPDTPVVASRRPQSSHNLQEPSKEHSSNVEVERATPTPSVKPAESGVLDPPSFEARVREASEAAYCALDGSSTSKHSWAAVMREAQLDLGIDDDGTIEALVLWQAHPREGRPTMGRLWQRSTKGGQGGRDWVRKQLKLGVNNDDPRNMRAGMRIIEGGEEIDRTPVTSGLGARTAGQW